FAVRAMRLAAGRQDRRCPDPGGDRRIPSVEKHAEGHCRPRRFRPVATGGNRAHDRRRDDGWSAVISSSAMRRLLNYFLRGLVVVTPLAVTIWVCVTIFETIDSWLGLRIRGAGFVIT